jgi:hypothetical protein
LGEGSILPTIQVHETIPSGKLIVTQLVKKFPAFKETDGSQGPTTSPYVEPDASSPHLLTPFPLNPF